MRKAVLEKSAVLKPGLSQNQQQQAWRIASAHTREQGHLFEANASEVAGNNFGPIGMYVQSSSNGGWRWHQLINHVDNQHRKMNTSDNTDVDFKEVESAFEVNGDEEGLLACSSDGIKVCGCGSRQKHPREEHAEFEGFVQLVHVWLCSGLEWADYIYAEGQEGTSRIGCGILNEV
jgi:hypothetical protein